MSAGAVSIIAAPALAAMDSDCAASGNPLEVQGFAVDTPNSHIEHAASGLTMRWRACGSEIFDGPDDTFPGYDSLDGRAEIQIPPGVATHAAPSADLPVGAYAGGAVIDALTWWDGGPLDDTALAAPNAHVTITVSSPSSTYAGGDWAGAPQPADCPPTAIACYLAISGAPVPWHVWVWVESSAGSTQLTMGPIYNDLDRRMPLAFTDIDRLSLCKYAGPVGGTSCGSDPSKWLQRNGDWSTPTPLGAGPEPTVTEKGGKGQGARCGAGYGRYTITVETRGGDTTAPASTCVDWFRQPEAVPKL